jgi:uncharacterized protein (DUF305 family)
MNKLTSISIAGAMIVSAGLAFAQSQADGGATHAGHGNHTTVSDTSTEDPAIAAYTATNARMHEDMAIEFTGDADVDFMRAMIPHHQGAIDMARVVLEHGSDPDVRALAQDVIAAQEAEIEMIENWLVARGH